MLQQNSCVNMYGKRGCGIELDCWVESSIVKPVKQHVSRHSTVKTCRRIGSAIDFVKSVRDSYRGKNAFDKHTTSRHSVPPPIADQGKGAWFCLSKNLIASDSNQQKPSITGSTDEEKKLLPDFVLDVETKGCSKLRDNFHRKIYESFADLRYSILQG